MGSYRIFVEKKKGFQTEAISLYNDLVNNLLVDLKGLRLLNIYDIFNIQESILLKAKKTVFSEIVVDDVYESIDLEGKKYLSKDELFTYGEEEITVSALLNKISELNQRITELENNSTV